MYADLSSPDLDPTFLLSQAAVKLRKVGNKQFIRIAHSDETTDQFSSIPETQAFGLIWEGGDLDYHNPFFSYQKLVQDFKQMMRLRKHKTLSTRLSSSEGVGLGFGGTKLSDHGEVMWNEEELLKEIGGPWKDKLADINLKRALKVLIDFVSIICFVFENAGLTLSSCLRLFFFFLDRE